MYKVGRGRKAGNVTLPVAINPLDCNISQEVARKIPLERAQLPPGSTIAASDGPNIHLPP